MNKVALAIQTVLSVGIGLVVNFFIVRAVLRKLDKPQDRRQQTLLAILLSILLAVPSAIRNKQLGDATEAASVA